MAACTPSIHVFLGRHLFLLSRGIKSIIKFGILSSGILLTWLHHCSFFLLYDIYGVWLPFRSHYFLYMLNFILGVIVILTHVCI